MKKTIILIFSIILITSCSENSSIENRASNEVETSVSTDSAALKTIINFYTWYRSNPNIQNCLVNNACGDVFDSTKFYSVNFEATEKYLSVLKNTNYISDNFINYWRAYFKKCEEDFKSNPSNEGPPDGFDFDFLTNSQDFEEELNTVEKATIVESKQIEGKLFLTILFVTGNKLKVELSQHDGKWLIDKTS